MQFIAHLSALALSAVEREDAGCLQQVTQSLQYFLADHVLCWSSEFLDAVQTHAQTPYYQGAAQLAAGCLAHTAQLLSVDLPVA
jgi:TorA maturation chaperone TorD